MRIFSTIFKISLFIIICTALYKEIYVDGAVLLEAFYFFTIQSNILVAFCLMLFVFVPLGDRNKCLIRGSFLPAITLTGIVYNFVLYNIFIDWETVGYTFPRTVTHVIAPLGFILDWIIFDKHGVIKVKDILVWLIYPVVYGLIFIYIDYRYSFSVYFFLSSAGGYGVMIMWLTAILCLLIVISLLYVGLDRFLGYLQINQRRKARIENV
ncbi:MAG: Pr6Pr family membrane protein [Defluviitaleaceae bacterium]|nr:Pr6Pr family membrane protein [Defluviitaleaceae bacterium]